jgi:hypothetical protein
VVGVINPLAGEVEVVEVEGRLGVAVVGVRPTQGKIGKWFATTVVPAITVSKIVSNLVVCVGNLGMFHLIAS